MILSLRQFHYRFPRPALIMGVVNITPDSFSDGGRYLDPPAAAAHALELAAEGADIIDLGGESTRPNATPVNAAEELDRVMPVLESLVKELKIPISIDTQKPSVAKAALAAGAALVNDIAANRIEDEMWRLVAESGAGYVLMHMQGTPQTMQLHPTYQDVTAEVAAFFSERLERLAACGVRPEQVILDVGIGFGKTLEHNLALLSSLDHFKKLHRPLLLGVSRKSFLGKLLGCELGERLPGALACAVWAVQQGVAMIRTHDVRETRQAVRMIETILNKRN